MAVSKDRAFDRDMEKAVATALGRHTGAEGCDPALASGGISLAPLRGRVLARNRGLLIFRSASMGQREPRLLVVRTKGTGRAIAAASVPRFSPLVAITADGLKGVVMLRNNALAVRRDRQHRGFCDRPANGVANATKKASKPRKARGFPN